MINTQYINLNITPSGVLPVLYCSQYDIGRPLGLVVYNGGEAVDLSTYTCTIEATRTDGTAITAAVTTNGNIGVFAATATMTNIADKYPAKMVIVDSAGTRVASLAFVMCVTPATMDENAEGVEEDASLYQQYTNTVQEIVANIRANLEAETTSRKNADDALQDAISTEVAARVSANAVLQGQIDSFVQLSPGSTTGDAELINIRVGADGVTYPTAGDAVRANDSALKSIIHDILTTGIKTPHIDSIRFVLGGISASSGGNISSTSRGRTVYIPITGAYAYLAVITNPEYAFINAWAYSDQNIESAIHKFDTINIINNKYFLPSINGDNFLRISFAHTDRESDITDEDLVLLSECVKLYKVTDDTLQIGGVPADAKKVGDEINAVHGILKASEDRLTIETATWIQGTINSAGILTDSTNRCRGYLLQGYDDALKFEIEIEDGYNIFIREYSEQHPSTVYYIGTPVGNTEHHVDLYPTTGHLYMVVLCRNDNADFTPEDIPENCVTANIYFVTDKTLSKARIPADAKVTGERISDIEEATEVLNQFYLTDNTQRTVNGIEISVPEDGTITLNGTATQTFRIYLMGSSINTPCAYQNETFIYSRELVSGSSDYWPVLMYITMDDDSIGTVFQKQPLTLDQDAALYLNIKEGKTFDNATYNFMLMRGNVLYGYYPHQKTAIDYIARTKSGADKPIRILGIGNSYTGNCLKWLWKILQACGRSDFIIGSGCYYSHNLIDIYNSIDPASSTHNAMTYLKDGPSGRISSETNNTNLDRILTDEPWDIVIFQQGGGASRFYESYDSDEFDINDLIQYVKNNIENANLKIGLCEVWSRTASYDHDYDPEWSQQQIEIVTPMAAQHMSQCDYVVRPGQAIKLARQNQYLDVIGDHLCRPEDHTHLQYGIPSFMCGMVYAITLCGIHPCDCTWYPVASDEGGTSNVPETDYMAFLAKQCALQASLLI